MLSCHIRVQHSNAIFSLVADHLTLGEGVGYVFSTQNRFICMRFSSILIKILVETAWSDYLFFPFFRSNYFLL